MVSDRIITNGGNLNGWFRWVMGMLFTIIFTLAGLAFTNVNAKVDENKILDKEQNDRITRIEIAISKIELLADDVKDIKSYLRRYENNR